MAQSIRKFGTNIYRPGVITYHNLDGLVNLDLGAEAAVLVIGEATSGQPQASAVTPVVHSFTDPQDMIDYFVGGNLAQMARCLFDPAMAGQLSIGVPIQGCKTVYAIKTNQSTQGSFSLLDAYPGGNAAVSLLARQYGVIGNQVWFKVETSGTGIILTAGRDVAPNIGSQVSPVFSATGVDEWVQIETAAGYTGASCTADFNGTNLVFNSSVANEDLTVVCTGKTMTEVANEVNSFKGVVPGANPIYLMTVLRSARLNTLSTYMDQFTGGGALNIHTGAKKAMGVAYDIYYWVTNNSYYLDATWTAGYEPGTISQTYLTGGSLGVTTNSTVVSDALKVATRMSPRFVASGYNADVGAGGAVTLAMINALFSTHATNCNNIGSACERQVFITNDDTTKAAMYTTISAFNNEYMACVNNEIYRENELGTKAWLGTHCTAATAAAMMAGSVIATPLTHRYIKASDVRCVATDFDSQDDTDFANGIINGLLFLETVPGTGIRFAKGITTYVLEDNDARCYLDVVESRIRHRVILRRALDVPEIGHKGRGIRTADSILRRVIEAHRLMSDPNDPDFILVEGTDSEGNLLPPYRNIRVSISADQVYVTGEVTFTEGVNWIINDFRATLPQAIVG